MSSQNLTGGELHCRHKKLYPLESIELLSAQPLSTQTLTVQGTECVLLQEQSIAPWHPQKFVSLQPQVLGPLESQ